MGWRSLRISYVSVTRSILTLLLCFECRLMLAADVDGDGLLDLMEVSGFDPNASEIVYHDRRGIQDLDGAALLTNATWLYLESNQITSIENRDFQGLANLVSIDLSGNQIASIENGGFQGLQNLKVLDLSANQIARVMNGSFLGLDHLESLFLKRSRITSIDVEGFRASRIWRSCTSKITKSQASSVAISKASTIWW